MITIISRRSVSVLLSGHGDPPTGLLPVAVVVVAPVPPVVVIAVVHLVARHDDLLICCKFTQISPYHGNYRIIYKDMLTM